MKLLKTIQCAVLGALIALGLAGCGQKEETPEPTPSLDHATPPPPTNPPTPPPPASE